MSRSLEKLDAEIARLWASVSLMAERRLVPLLLARQALDEVAPEPRLDDPSPTLEAVIGTVASAVAASKGGRLHHHRVDDLIQRAGISVGLRRADAKALRDRMVAGGILVKGTFGMLSVGAVRADPSEPPRTKAKRRKVRPARNPARAEAPPSAPPSLIPPPGDRVATGIVEILAGAPAGLSRFEIMTRLEVRYGCCPSTSMLGRALNRYAVRLGAGRWGLTDPPPSVESDPADVPDREDAVPKPGKASPGRFKWTREREHVLRTMLESGASDSRIIRTLGPGVTKNSIVSKARRMRVGRPHRNPGTPA